MAEGGATLIITPSTLLGQYITEIDKCTHMGAVPTAVYTGNQRVHFYTRQLRMLPADGGGGGVGRRCQEEEVEEGMTVLAPVCVFDEEGEEEGIEEDEERRARRRAQYYEGTVTRVMGGGSTAAVTYAYTPDALAGLGIVLCTYETLRCVL